MPYAICIFHLCIEFITDRMIQLFIIFFNIFIANWFGFFFRIYLGNAHCSSYFYRSTFATFNMRPLEQVKWFRRWFHRWNKSLKSTAAYCGISLIVNHSNRLNVTFKLMLHLRMKNEDKTKDRNDSNMYACTQARRHALRRLVRCGRMIWF